MSERLGGAGPAGATTALLLARYGVEVTLVERETSFERVFRGEGLISLGIEALLQMSLRETLESVPYRLVLSWKVWIDGEEAFVVPELIEELGGRAMRVVSEPALLERVVDEANQYPSFTCERGARVRDLIRGPTGRVVGVQLVTETGSREERADLVLGCDGRGSLVRTRADLQLELLPEHYDVLWYKLPAPEALREGCSIMIAVAAKRHPAICYTSCDERLQYGLVMPKSALEEMRQKDWVSESVGSAPGWLAEHVLANRDQIEGPVRLNVLVGRCPEWSAPGVLLLGDASHPMSPVRAQGINLALRDAIVAASHLVSVLRDNAGTYELDAACRAVQMEREPEIVRSQKLQRREARGQEDARSRSWRFKLAKRGAFLSGSLSLGPERLDMAPTRPTFRVGRCQAPCIDLIGAGAGARSMITRFLPTSRGSNLRTELSRTLRFTKLGEQRSPVFWPRRMLGTRSRPRRGAAP